MIQILCYISFSFSQKILPLTLGKKPSLAFEESSPPIFGTSVIKILDNKAEIILSLFLVISNNYITRIRQWKYRLPEALMFWTWDLFDDDLIIPGVMIDDLVSGIRVAVVGSLIENKNFKSKDVWEYAKNIFPKTN